MSLSAHFSAVIIMHLLGNLNLFFSEGKFRDKSIFCLVNLVCFVAIFILLLVESLINDIYICVCYVIFESTMLSS